MATDALKYGKESGSQSIRRAMPIDPPAYTPGTELNAKFFNEVFDYIDEMTKAAR